MLHRRLNEGTDCHIGCFYIEKNLCSCNLGKRIVVGVEALPLRLNEKIREILDFLWEFSHDFAIFAPIGRVAMVGRAVGLGPGLFAPIGATPSDEAVGAVPAKRVKEGVVDCAGGAAQVALAMAAAFARQSARGADEIKRLQQRLPWS